MIFEVRKAGFYNKGAHLMLMAVLEQLKNNYPEANIAMAPFKAAPYINRAKLGLLQKAAYYRYRTQWGFLSYMVPRDVLSLFGMIRESEIDVVFDLAGFSYSDQWGTGSISEAAKATRRWKKRGIHSVFMPQAFGPFENKKNRRNIEIVIDNADLIYARDMISYQNLTEVGGSRPYIKVAPDFTNLVNGVVPSDFDKSQNRFCIVPNCRMLDKTPDAVSRHYISFLIKCIDRLIECEAKPFILIHDADSDKTLAEEIIQQLNSNINIVQESDPIKIKGVIGCCDGMIGSRFHGLVSALSQGVPVIATGWSHKYQELLRDYNYEEGLVSFDMPDNELFDLIDLLADRRTSAKIKLRINEASHIQKEKTQNMWQEIYSFVSHK
jgi:colanic acid/amylovoran biosynthesis protein